MNSHLESTNNKVKSICLRYASLEQFFHEFFKLLACLRGEHTHIMMLAKHQTVERLQEIKSYKRLLTPYAFSVVCKQYNLSCQLSPMDVDGKEFVFQGSAGEVKATLIGCSCMQFVTTGLSCKHILFTQKQHLQSLFDNTDNNPYSLKTISLLGPV